METRAFPDAVDEFRVLQSNFSPEYGQSGDGIVSLTLKIWAPIKCTDLFMIISENTGLNANSWVKTLAAQREAWTSNDFGGTLEVQSGSPKSTMEKK